MVRLTQLFAAPITCKFRQVQHGTLSCSYVLFVQGVKSVLKFPSVGSFPCTPASVRVPHFNRCCAQVSASLPESCCTTLCSPRPWIPACAEPAPGAPLGFPLNSLRECMPLAPRATRGRRGGLTRGMTAGRLEYPAPCRLVRCGHTDSLPPRQMSPAIPYTPFPAGSRWHCVMCSASMAATFPRSKGQA